MSAQSSREKGAGVVKNLVLLESYGEGRWFESYQRSTTQSLSSGNGCVISSAGCEGQATKCDTDHIIVLCCDQSDINHIIILFLCCDQGIREEFCKMVKIYFSPKHPFPPPNLHCCLPILFSSTTASPFPSP